MISESTQFLSNLKKIFLKILDSISLAVFTLGSAEKKIVKSIDLYYRLKLNINKRFFIPAS